MKGERKKGETLDQNRLVGCWKLVSYEFRSTDGKVMYPLGRNPVGLAMIGGGGNISTQIMRRDRQKFKSDWPVPEEMQDVFRDYAAYFGFYKINEKDSILVTYVEGSLNPNWVGGYQVRYFEFSDEQVIFRTPPMTVGNTEAVGTMVWEKMPAPSR